MTSDVQYFVSVCLPREAYRVGGHTVKENIWLTCQEISRMQEVEVK